MFQIIIRAAKKSYKNANYARSNSISNVKFLPSDLALQLSSKILISFEADDRQRLSEALLDELSDAAGIDVVEVAVTDENQVHKRRGSRIIMKKYGSYRPGSKIINISNRTAARGQILASKSFLDTLLHEWIHHYDTYKLKINSIHSKGFYGRLNDLKIKLKIPKKTV
ncbi:MAG: hypothetical protein WCT26_03730 [Candidatus Buchananbacteria bacterium]|jgi:hypothetical protein